MHGLVTSFDGNCNKIASGWPTYLLGLLFLIIYLFPCSFFFICMHCYIQNDDIGSYGSAVRKFAVGSKWMLKFVVILEILVSLTI